MGPALNSQTEAWAAPLERQLASHVALREEHRAFVREGLGEVQTHEPEDVTLGGARGARQPVLLAAGWAAAVAHLQDGRKQIVSLFLPGDIIDPALDLRTGLTPQSLTSVRTVEARRLVAAMSEDLPGALQPLLAAWTLSRAAAESRLVRQVIRLGRLSAYERTADLLLDLQERQERAGLADGRGMRMPVTQEMLADHLGLSVVHMNRTLQQLRRERLIDYRGGRVLIPEPARLDAVRRRLDEK